LGRPQKRQRTFTAGLSRSPQHHDEAVEQEPNNDPSKANRITVPGGITGRFQQSDDTDYYIFSAKKGQKLAIEAQTLELYSPRLSTWC